MPFHKINCVINNSKLYINHQVRVTDNRIVKAVNTLAHFINGNIQEMLNAMQMA